MTQEEMYKISNHFNKQEGLAYPISNQVVVCGLVSTDLNDWKEFVEKLDKEKISRIRQFEVILSNNERWVYINPNNDHVRGYRFYKVIANKNTDKKIIYERIIPLCACYCKSFEWF